MRRAVAFAIALVCLLTTGLAGTRGSVLLVGGGSEDYNDWSDRPYRWLVEHAPNRRIAILHYSTTSSWLVSYFRWLGAASDTSFAITSVAGANDSACYRAIVACDGVFLRGGDQLQYVNLWKGTLAEQAIREVYARGGVVGGSSAGMAVLSEVIFDARITSVNPRTALRNPLGSGVTFAENFLGFAPGIVGDTHFYERGRLGRLLAMLAIRHSQTGQKIAGIGVDYNTALAIDSAGTGEVMGAGTVTVLRWRPETEYSLETGKPLAVKNLAFDQLTDGFKVALPSGPVTPALTARQFTVDPFESRPSPVILDGGNSEAEWNASSGGLTALAGRLIPGDTVGVITSPVWGPAAQTVALSLGQRQLNVRQLWIDGLRNNDAALANGLRSCRGIVFVANRPDSIAFYLDTSSVVGEAFRAASAAGVLLTFLGNEAKIVADTLVGRTEASAYAAYYGQLTLWPGLRLVPSVTVMPRLYEHADSIDNRASGLFWAQAKSQAAFGFLLDAGTTLTLDGDQVSVSGSTPCMVLDAREVSVVDFPTWRDPGKLNPRQNAAFVGGTIHVIRQGEPFTLSGGGTSDVTPRADTVPAGYWLGQNYPNPFNPSTTMQYALPESAFVRITVHDILGNEVATLVHGHHASGTYTVQFDGSRMASGIYFCMMRAGGFAGTHAITLLR